MTTQQALAYASYRLHAWVDLRAEILNRDNDEDFKYLRMALANSTKFKNRSHGQKLRRANERKP